MADAEGHLGEEQDGQRRSYLVGYTVSGYLLDRYPLATLKDHNGQQLEAEVVPLPARTGRMDMASRSSGTPYPLCILSASFPAKLNT